MQHVFTLFCLIFPSVFPTSATAQYYDTEDVGLNDADEAYDDADVSYDDNDVAYDDADGEYDDSVADVDYDDDILDVSNNLKHCQSSNISYFLD